MSYFTDRDVEQYQGAVSTSVVNQIISSSTTIPVVTPLDCLWVEKSENSKEEYEYDIRGLYSDPADQDNYILLKSKRIQHFEYKDSLECNIKDRPDFSLKIIDIIKGLKIVYEH